jgi:endonuclease/exonuclease/phosphatase family metal-dependent hydrolase
MTDAPGGGPVRVATFNVRAAIGPGPFPDRWWRHADPHRLERIANVVRSLDADLVGLQEVALIATAGLVVDQSADLGRETGSVWRYGATRTFPIDDDGELVGAGLFGNAILSRHPIRSARTVGLPMAPMDAFVEPAGSEHPAAGLRYADAPSTIREPRCILVCEVELPSGVATVASTHLSHVGAGERRLQAEAVALALRDVPLPIILLGDFNAPIDRPELAPLRDRMVDAFAATDTPPGDPARRSTDDGYPIDHVFLQGIGATSCRVVRESGEASDHFPVLATLSR